MIRESSEYLLACLSACSACQPVTCEMRSSLKNLANEGVRVGTDEHDIADEEMLVTLEGGEHCFTDELLLFSDEGDLLRRRLLLINESNSCLIPSEL